MVPYAPVGPLPVAASRTGRTRRKGASAMQHEWGAPVARQRVAVIDNYDSFVYILVQYLGAMGAEPIVFRNDDVSVDGLIDLAPDAVVISPGPGRPEDAGISAEVVKRMAGMTPILGVCLGHQCIGQVYGADIVRADAITHGKTSPIHHRGQGVLAGLPDPFDATRYHSLVVDPNTLPTVLEVTAETPDGTIMALRHRALPVEGVQFHPESILTVHGRQLLATFVAGAGWIGEEVI